MSLKSIQQIQPLLKKSYHGGKLITTGYYKTIVFQKHGDEAGWYINPNTYFKREARALNSDQELLDYLNTNAEDDSQYKPTL